MTVTASPFLAVNEIFETMQGEATHTGTPAIFVRLQGCQVGCPWCDTKFTWDLRQEDEAEFETVLHKQDSGTADFARVMPEDLAGEVLSYRSGLVVITGGEPCAQDLTDFTELLLRGGKRVQIETSGTQEVRAAPGAWVTVSPKIGMPGGFKVRRDAVQRADEIKMPVGKMADVEALLAFLAEMGDPKPLGGIWVQPLSRSAKATALCIEMATRHGWRISIQTHAFIGVR